MSHDQSPTPAQRFTRYGSYELEQNLQSACERVANEIREIVPLVSLDGLLLAGGFGSGEGGVLATPEGQRAFGEFEFVLLAREGTEPAVQALAVRLEALGERMALWTGAVGTFRITTRQQIADSETSPFLHELARGHRVLIGPESLSASWTRHQEPSAISLQEVTHLLFQRCSGLLCAARRLQRAEFTSEDADAVHRQLSRLELALGDVVLAAHGEYRGSSVERHQRLATFTPAEPVPNLSLIYEMHAWGLSYKLRPTRGVGGRENLQRRLTTLATVARDLWLWLEGRRLGQKFRTAACYADSAINKCPGTSRWESALLSCRLLGLPALFTGKLAHPRQRLFHALALLLWEPALFNTPRLRAHLARELHHPVRTFAEAAEAYTALRRQCDAANPAAH